VKLTDLITPAHVLAAYRKYESMPPGLMGAALDVEMDELIPIANVISRSQHGREFAMVMMAISIVDLAIREATAGKTQ
jgi:hypothetical protein